MKDKEEKAMGITIGMVIGLVGSIALYYITDWKIVLSILVMLWGNNIVTSYIDKP